MNLPGLCQSCTARDFDCVNELDRIEMNSTRDGVYECSRYKFKEATVSDYCGDCEQFPGRLPDLQCDFGGMPAYSNHPACRKFSAKKRTCGECMHPYWRDFDDFGVCYHRRDDNKEWYIENRTVKACDNFNGEA